jgi:hypothetical protein
MLSLLRELGVRWLDEVMLGCSDHGNDHDYLYRMLL